ncbi:MAG: polysaccharide deacetylase family protein [Oscillospiraceae bacterium]|nr:polysaccharide deacetylase family protein [Oscillospiraceae bacterium]
MNLPLYSLLRRANRMVKARKKARAGAYLSPCRRIEFVYPPKRRVCAMTFDDGPCMAGTVPDVSGGGSLTGYLLDVLASYRARGVFDVIGSTAENYPDRAGKENTLFIFGRAYDHYAYFEGDALAGVAACPALLRRMAAEGHELANHSYRHLLFGRNLTVYRRRRHWHTLDEVVGDLSRLHEAVENETGVAMRLARPPHYVDRIPDGSSAYDAYIRMGYQYMAASADGGCWFPSSQDDRADAEASVSRLRALLQDDPDALRGKIIFQKDGYNMSRRSPVALALPLQLQLLSDYGYEVVTVSEMLDLSPFEDLSPDDPCFDAARAMLRDGHVVGYRNNSCQPDRVVTAGELCQMAAGGQKQGQQGQQGQLTAAGGRNPYAGVLDWAVGIGLYKAGVDGKAPASAGDIARAARLLGLPCDRPRGNTRRDAILALGAGNAPPA